MAVDDVSAALYTAPHNIASCCLCPRPIGYGERIWYGEVNGPRYAHVACIQRLIIGVIEKRDEAGRSEDRKGLISGPPGTAEKEESVT